MKHRLLTQEEVESVSARLPQWSCGESVLTREFTFSDFEEAFGFMVSVAEVAKSLDHHPDWCNSWNQVSVSLSTHSAGGLTVLDLSLAEAMETVAANFAVRLDHTGET